MDLVVESISNPMSDADELKVDSDAELAPALLLVHLYGGKLMQLGPFMPPLLVFFGAMNAYARNDEFMWWEQEARCWVDEDTPFFKACEEDYKTAGGDEDDADDHCYAFYCSVPDSSVHTDRGVLGPDHVERPALWTEGQPCPTGFGQYCFKKHELDPEDMQPLNILYRGLAGVASLFIGAVSFSLRRATAPEGTLKHLGLGETKITEKAARRLKQWQVALSVLLFGLYSWAVTGPPPMEKPIYLFCWPCAFVWYLALKE